MERETRYWVAAQAGHKQDKLFELRNSECLGVGRTG